MCCRVLSAVVSAWPVLQHVALAGNSSAVGGAGVPGPRVSAVALRWHTKARGGYRPCGPSGHRSGSQASECHGAMALLKAGPGMYGPQVAHYGRATLGEAPEAVGRVATAQPARPVSVTGQWQVTMLALACAAHGMALARMSIDYPPHKVMMNKVL